MVPENFSRNPRAVLFRDWLRDLDIVLGRNFAWHPLGELEAILECWGRVLVDPRVLSGWYREGGSRFLSVKSDDLVWSYVARCLGHRLNRRVVLSNPRMSVLCWWSGWLDCGGVLGSDYVAHYLYAVVRGGLPDHLHSRLVLEGMVCKDQALVRYLRDFG
jgi:hypothetical protein